MAQSRKYIYLAYLQSDHWRKLRAYAVRRRPTCEACGKPDQIEVHHLKYREPLESCTISDLMVLCGGCHSWTHGIPDLRQHMDGCPDNLARRSLVLDLCAGRFRGGRKALDRTFHRRTEKRDRQLSSARSRLPGPSRLPTKGRFKPYTPQLSRCLAEAQGIILS